jgi:outer membrane biosynthesis protein TonB
LRTSAQKKSKEWLIIVAVVVALHALLFISVRPSFFSMFKKTTTSTAEGYKGEPFAPSAILTIPIEIEDPQPDKPQEPIQDNAEPTPTETKKIDHKPVVATQEAVNIDEGDPSDAPLDVENVLGESPETLPHNIGPEEVMIPPRALEITWPDTRDLGHCLGHHIDMMIHVDENGSIVAVEPLDSNHPPDCIRAAVESARHIVFEPGRVNGLPSSMWTQVRIDFRKKK